MRCGANKIPFAAQVKAEGRREGGREGVSGIFAIDRPSCMVCCPTLTRDAGHTCYVLTAYLAMNVDGWEWYKRGQTEEAPVHPCVLVHSGGEDADRIPEMRSPPREGRGGVEFEMRAKGEWRGGKE